MGLFWELKQNRSSGPTFHLVLHVGGKMRVHNENKVCEIKDSSVKYNIICVDMVQMK
jgi:hypothetical protein